MGDKCDVETGGSKMVMSPSWAEKRGGDRGERRYRGVSKYLLFDQTMTEAM